MNGKWTQTETEHGYRTQLCHVGTERTRYVVARVEEYEQGSSGQHRYCAGPTDKTVWVASVLTRQILRDPYVGTFETSKQARDACKAELKRIALAVLA